MGGKIYICKNRHGTFYVRLLIPKPLLPVFKNKKEIRRSLKTDSRKIAIKRARVYRVEFETIIDQFMTKEDNTAKLAKGAFSAYQVMLEGSTVATLPNGHKMTVTGKIERNLLPGEDTTPHKEYLARQLMAEARHVEEQAERLEKQARDRELHQAQLAAITTGTIAAPIPNKPVGKTVSAYIDDYVAHKLTPGKKGTWDVGTARQKPNKLRSVFGTVFGDKLASALTREDIEQYIKIAWAIPANFGNPDHTKYKGITLDMILANTPDIETLDYKTRSAGTIRDDLKTIKAFLSWVSKYKDIELKSAINALGNEICDIDYESSRRAFTKEELKLLFESNNPAPENYIKGFSSPINYWVQFIALYTGARLAEICQLYLSDIKQVDVLSNDTKQWVFDINDNDDKSLKSKSSKRQIPIHPNLTNAGLLAYVDSQKAKGETRLFPDAARNSDQFGGQSQWFGIYSDKAGIPDKDTAFHSFRHVFCSYLKARYTETDLINALVGHQDISLAKKTYSRNGQMDVGKLADVINSIDYGLQHPNFYKNINSSND
jgi:integrase